MTERWDDIETVTSRHGVADTPCDPPWRVVEGPPIIEVHSDILREWGVDPDDYEYGMLGRDLGRRKPWYNRLWRRLRKRFA